MRELIKKLTAQSSTWYTTRSKREQNLVLAMIACGIIILVVTAQVSITSFIKSENQRTSELKKQVDTATEAARRYSDLLQKRKAVEAAFSQLTWKESGESAQGEMSYLESLNAKFLKVQEATRPDDRFRIDPQAVVPFGKEYDRAQFRISFPVSKLEQLATFLSELSNGEKPLLVTRLRVERRPSGDALSVQVDVSSVRQKT